MRQPEPDTRSPERKLLDEQIAAEPKRPIPKLPPDSRPIPLEEHLKRIRRRPVAVMGIVENGVVRPIDPQVNLPEHSRVIIVASAPA